MGKYQIGEFEEIVMLTVAILHGNAYGISIKQHIEETQGRKVSVGALQSCLQRLETKGYLLSKEGESTAVRGGRPKKYMEITAAGKKALAMTRETRNKLWDSIPTVVMEMKFSK